MEERGRYLSRRGFMCAAVSVWVLLRKEQASNSANTVCSRDNQLNPINHISSPKSCGRERKKRKTKQTSQPINSPLLKLLQRNIRRRRRAIEIQSIFIFQRFIFRRGELFLAMVDRRSPHCCVFFFLLLFSASPPFLLLSLLRFLYC